MDLEISLPTFFFFEHLPIAEAKNAIQALGTAAADVDAVEMYERWLRGFWKKSHSYYRAQLLRYQTLVEQKFYRKYGIHDGDPICGLDEEYESWMEHVQMQKYMDNTNSRLKRLEWQMKEWDNKNRVQGDVISASLLDATSSLVYTNLNERWFIRSVDSANRSRQHIKSRSYETYLNSQGWRRVRAAIILIYEATCQDPECYNTMDRWYLDDSDLNVHHTTYANLGQEHFSDLTLLCRRHHEHVHMGGIASS